MKVRVSKVFAKFISDTCKERGIEARACVCSFTGHNQAREYEFTVGDVWDAYANNDLDSHGNLCALCITWPEDYYALPRYVSTQDLAREFRGRNVRTWDELKDMVCDMFEI